MLRNIFKSIKAETDYIAIYLLIGMSIPVILGFSDFFLESKLTNFFYSIHEQKVIADFNLLVPLFLYIGSEGKRKILAIYLFPVLSAIFAATSYYFSYKFDLILIKEDFTFKSLGILSSTIFSYVTLYVLSIPLLIVAMRNDIHAIKNFNDEVPFKRVFIILSIMLVFDLYGLFFHHYNYGNAQIYAIIASMVLYVPIYLFFIAKAIYQKNLGRKLLYFNLIVFMIAFIQYARIYNLLDEERGVIESIMLSVSTITGYTPASADIEMSSLEHLILQIQRVISMIIFGTTSYIIISLSKNKISV